jgi:hypothetical protein
MQIVIKKYCQSNPGKRLLSISFIILLLFLTSANYFLYSSPGKAGNIIAWSDGGNEEPSTGFQNSPAGPDEKSPDTPVSVTEEYVHEHDSPVNPLWTNAIFQHMIHATEKLRVVHFELLSPPPEA